MRVRRLTIRNFRGVSVGTVDFPQHTLVVGGSNVGESTVCEALELSLQTTTVCGALPTGISATTR
jgi:putative ATP-dependent endonuclease of OLD family